MRSGPCGRRRRGRRSGRAGGRARSITSSSRRPGASCSETSLKAPSRSNAGPSASRLIHSTPKRLLSGNRFVPLDLVDVLGRDRDPDDAQRLPAAVAARRRGGRPTSSRLASAKASLASTSSGRPGSIQRPRRRWMSFRIGARIAGIDTSRPVAGSARPGTSSVTCATMRVSTAATPGIAASAVRSDSGARLSAAKTSAKRYAA